MRVRVLFFGPARDLAQCEIAEMNLPDDASVEVAIEQLSRKFPSLQSVLSRWRIAVNAEYADASTPLYDGDEIAVIPPVTGGADLKGEGQRAELGVLVGVTEKPIELAELVAFVSTPEAGAVVTFLGTVRNQSKGKTVTALTYGAYEPMAEKELKRIAEEMQKRWQVCKVAIVHRVGKLRVGEVSVAIFVSAPHREDAFAAARHAIERIKEIVPIWKREHFSDGTTEWVMEKHH